MAERFNEITDVGQVYLSGCQSLAEGDFIGFSVAEGYDDDGEYSAVILGAYGGVAGFRYHLSPHQAESLAHLLLEAAKEVQTFQNIKELNQ